MFGSAPEFSATGSDCSTGFSTALAASCPFPSFVGVDGCVAAGRSSESSAVVNDEPSDAMLTRVVVASAGRDRVDAPAFLVSCIEGLRCCREESAREIEESATVDTTLWATDMLSRATSVTGAALDTREMADQDPGYQLWRSRIDERLVTISNGVSYRAASDLPLGFGSVSLSDLGPHCSMTRKTASPRQNGWASLSCEIPLVSWKQQ